VIEMVPKPRLIRRDRNLGWLAVSPPKARIRIGVTAKTEAAAEHEFWSAYVRWCELVPLVQPLYIHKSPAE
jgi:hypothetical protein